MPCSMTGMGKAVHRGKDCSIEVEVKSVNNRYLVIKNHFSDSLMKIEPRLHGAVRRIVKRGTVDLFIKVKYENRTSPSRINKQVLSGYIKAFADVRKKEKLAGDVTPEQLSGLPGVVEFEERADLPQKLLVDVESATVEALERLHKMRSQEGTRMIRVVVKRRRLVEKGVKTIEKMARNSARDRSLRLKARLEELLDGAPLSAQDPTLQREVAVLADRSDITEELDRLKSHLEQFDKILEGGGEIGRQVDFMLQEMGREVNTIGSKACDAAVSHEVVKVKAELEKIREQVQNIE